MRFTSVKKISEAGSSLDLMFKSNALFNVYYHLYCKYIIHVYLLAQLCFGSRQEQRSVALYIARLYRTNTWPLVVVMSLMEELSFHETTFPCLNHTVTVSMSVVISTRHIVLEDTLKWVMVVPILLSSIILLRFLFASEFCKLKAFDFSRKFETSK